MCLVDVNASRYTMQQPACLKRFAWLQQRCACKDATPASPLRKIVNAKSRKRLDGMAATPANEITSESEADEYARKEDVQARTANCCVCE